MPNMAIYEYDQYGNETPNYFAPQSNAQGQFPTTFNPVAMAREAKNKLISNQVIPTFKLNYTITKWLNYAFDVRYTVENNIVKQKLPKDAVGRIWYDHYNNMLENEDRLSYSFYARNALSFNPYINENHKFSGLIASEITTGEGYWFDILGSNAASSAIEDINTDLRLYSGQATGDGPDNTKYKFRSLSGIGNVTYTFKDKYILNGTARVDKDPKFGENYQTLYFGGAGVRWRISAENFMKSLTFINDLSIRANWGINGNSAINSNNGRFAKYNSYSFVYLENESGVAQQNLQLNNFRPEEKTQTNIGFNLFMLDNRINVDVNLWNEVLKSGFRKDMQIPTTSGYSTMDVNIMEGHNSGFDIDIKASVLKQENSSVDLRFNCSRSQFIPDNISSYYNTALAWSTPTNGQFRYNPRDNTPLGSIFGLKYKGVYKDLDATIARDDAGNKIYNAQGDPVYMTYNYPNVRYIFQPGDAIYEDINKDGNINYNDVVYLGNSNPLFTGGFGSTFRYKNLLLDMYFYFRYNFDIVNITKYYTENMSSFDNQSTAVLRRWRNPGDVTDIPRAMLGNNYNSIGSDRFIEDGSFIRLKTITLNYMIPKKLVNSLKLKDARIYLTVSNLFTLTNYSGQDPEVSIKADDERLVSEDNARTPRSKEFTLGINVGF
jgi:TonB-linked SusC/RagA family outer membrane protein